jgi:phosphomannomutase/phosphoglucomutase
VGRDNRPSGAGLAAAVRQGIVDAGGTAIDVGEVPTPALYFATQHLSADAGLQVTGSHNPPEFNGFKMVLAGAAVHGDEILALHDTISTESWRTGSGTERTAPGMLTAYREAILARHHLARPVKVVVDCGNGVASLVAVDTIAGLGAEVTGIFCDSDGTFPNHHPDPTVPENLHDLQAAVARTGAELGIAFDGDGDRIGAVDEHRRFGAGVSVIFDVKCSELLPQALERAGAVPVMWKTGHSLIKAKMKEMKAPLAGEMSGHMFFGGDWFGFDDALFAAARLLEIVAAQPGGLSRLLADLPTTYTTPEIRVDVPEEIKFEVVSRAAEHFAARYRVNTIDGVRMAFADGWGLIRASNTQPVLVLRFEATSEAALARYRDEVTQWLAGQGVRA